LIRSLPPSERKPNPVLLRNICDHEGFRVEECCYVGDSLIRDVAMAKEAGVKAVWARYGTRYDTSLWDLLVAVTHWTPRDVEREARLKEAYRDVKPDVTIESFSEVASIMGLLPTRYISDLPPNRSTISYKNPGTTT
jgi:phosphoglycolate phosphatase